MGDKSLYGIFGASGFGREVMPLLRDQVGVNGKAECVFIDDNPPESVINGHRALTYDEFLLENAEQKFVSLAIANSEIRERLEKRCVEAGILFFDLSHSSNVILDEVKIGEGSILAPFVTLTSNILIGNQFHANIYSYIAHDCVIGDYVTFAPRVMCNGNIYIEDHVYIGTGAIIKQGTPDKPLVIGKGAVVGMGAVVTKSVDPGAVVVGNPAKPFSRRA